MKVWTEYITMSARIQIFPNVIQDIILSYLLTVNYFIG